MNKKTALLSLSTLTFITPAVIADTVINVDKAGLHLEADNFTFNVGGRILLDGAYLFEDGGSARTEVRAARLEVEGTFLKDWEYKTQLDFGGESKNTSIKDMYIGYTGFPVGIKAGNFKEPFSLEEQTSSRHITFMERSIATQAFAPSRHMGLGFGAGGDTWTANAGLFGGTVDTKGDEGYGVAARGTWSPAPILHVGVGAEYRDTANGVAEFGYRPGSHLVGETAVEVETGSVTKVGGELASVLGPFSLQGEYYYADTDAGSADGWYAQASWILTGESRPYKEGKFGQIKPKRNIGAFEVAAQYSQANLGKVTGSDDSQTTFGVNWYPNTNVRLTVDYTMADTLEYDDDVIGARAQVYF